MKMLANTQVIVASPTTDKRVFVNAYVQIRNGSEVPIRAHWRRLPRRKSKFVH